jgi:hypothetical protein
MKKIFLTIGFVSALFYFFYLLFNNRTKQLSDNSDKARTEKELSGTVQVETAIKQQDLSPHKVVLKHFHEYSLRDVLHHEDIKLSKEDIERVLNRWVCKRTNTSRILFYDHVS